MNKIFEESVRDFFKLDEDFKLGIVTKFLHTIYEKTDDDQFKFIEFKCPSFKNDIRFECTIFNEHQNTRTVSGFVSDHSKLFFDIAKEYLIENKCKYDEKKKFIDGLITSFDLIQDKIDFALIQENLNICKKSNDICKSEISKISFVDMVLHAEKIFSMNNLFEFDIEYSNKMIMQFVNVWYKQGLIYKESSLRTSFMDCIKNPNFYFLGVHDKFYNDQFLFLMEEYNKSFVFDVHKYGANKYILISFDSFKNWLLERINKDLPLKSIDFE